MIDGVSYFPILVSCYFIITVLFGIFWAMNLMDPIAYRSNWPHPILAPFWPIVVLRKLIKEFVNEFFKKKSS